VPEHLHAVDGDDRNVILITPEQAGIAFNVDLGERIVVGTTGGGDHLFGVVAKMTTRTAIDHYV